MSFVLKNFSRVSVSYNQDVPRGYRYVSVDDEAATIALPGYFDALKASLKIGDTIVISGADENRELVVTQITPQVLTDFFIVTLGHPIIVLTDRGNVANTPIAQQFPLFGARVTDLIFGQIINSKASPALLINVDVDTDVYTLTFNVNPGIDMEYNIAIIRVP